MLLPSREPYSRAMNELDNTAEPYLVSGGLAVDDRGQLSFYNDLILSDYKRQYFVQNHTSGFIRAWHGHRYESKAVTVVTGAALVCAVRVSDWSRPDRGSPIHRHVLAATLPSALIIPAGYANGFMTLQPNTVIQFLSSATLEESAADDIRFDARLWDPWNVVER